MTNKKLYQPKGGMCAGCKFKNDNCSELEFSKMPVIDKDDEVMIVRCIKYKRQG
jgi:hypothetical protein